MDLSFKPIFFKTYLMYSNAFHVGI